MIEIDRVFYINLDSRTDRKILVEQELLKLFSPNLIERFPAISHQIGKNGCALSHIEVLKISKSRNYKNVIIVEDDFQIINLDTAKSTLYSFLNEFNDYKFLFLTAHTKKYYPTNYKYLIHPIEAQTTTAYLINHTYFNTLLENYIEALSVSRSIDKNFKKLQTTDTFLQLYPVSMIQREGYSDIIKKNVNYRDFFLYINNENNNAKLNVEDII